MAYGHETIQKIRELAEDKRNPLGSTVIASRLGIPRGSVIRLCRKNGIVLPGAKKGGKEVSAPRNAPWGARKKTTQIPPTRVEHQVVTPPAILGPSAKSSGFCCAEIRFRDGSTIVTELCGKPTGSPKKNRCPRH